MSIVSLGYVGLEVSDLAAWNAFATNVLGLMPGQNHDGSARFRLDEMEWRIAATEGPANDIAYAGFELSSASDLALIEARLIAAGVTVQRASPEQMRERGVLGLVTCADPEGLQVELYYGATSRRETPFASPVGGAGFLTGEQGLGHIVLATADIDAARKFYGDLLGFRLSDIISMQVAPEFAIDMEFYHCNARHHTLALVPAPAPRRLHHLMLQTVSLDDVGFALDRAIAAETRITASLGKHTNDQMISFYAETPAGFEVEYGWGAREIEAAWRVERHERTSTWGHRTPERPDATA